MKASPFDYASIEPLLSSAEIRSASVFCRFTCPVTGRAVSASADLRPLPAKRDLAEDAEVGVLTGLRRSLAATLGGVVGAREHADAQVEIANADPVADAPGIDPDEQIRRYAIIRAFRSVSSLFRWELERRRWVAVDAQRETMTRFESQLAVHPVRDTADLPMLLRMVVAITRADGKFAEEERQFLKPFEAAAGVSIDDLASQADPSSEELRSIDRSRRESALMICWAAALSDGALKDVEKVLLDRFAKELGITPEGAAELCNRAQYYLLERTLEDVFSDFHMTVEEEDLVVRVGANLGLPLAETQNAIERFRKRRGFE